MKKFFLFAVAAVAVFASCSKNESQVALVQAEEGAIAFNAYTGSAVTKGTQVEAADIWGTSNPGIGVFAFYQPAIGGVASNFTTRKYATPDFMYNQPVTSTDGNTWTYSPIKYWPNNQNDQLSFFAYAPYKATMTWEDFAIATDVNGTELTKAFVIDSDPASQIDLLWTKPQTNLTKQKVAVGAGATGQADTPIKFQFTHVLSQINLQIGVEQNNATATPSAWNDANTQIEVNSIAFNGVYDTYTYKLSTDTWTASGSQDVVMTAANFDNNTSTSWTAAQFYNLTKAGSSLFLAPQKSDAQDIEFVINYTVTTTDAKLPGGKSVVTNIIKKKLSDYTATTDALKDGFEAGKSYLLKFLIGMNQVTLSADVTPWADGGEQQLDVPANI